MVGAGVIGCEYASIFAALGVRVTLIDKRDRLLPFIDTEIADALCHHLRENRATLRLSESVNNLEVVEDEHGARVRLHLDSGKTVHAEKALYSVGRTGATGSLNLQSAGLSLRQSRAPAGRRTSLHRNPQCLCGWGRDRVSRTRFDLDGAGPSGRLPCLWCPHTQRS